MKKMIISAVAVLSIIGSVQAMETDIEFKGEKKPLLGWIMASMLDQKHPFSVTSVVRYENDKFTMSGDILNLSERDLEDVKNNNCVYCSFYALEKTRLSQGSYENVGAIIFGTKDLSLCQKLHFAKMRSLMGK